MILLGRIKTGTESQPQLIATNEHGTATKLFQMLQHFQAIVGFDGVSNNGTQPLQCLFVGHDIPGNLGLAVEIKRPPFHGFHNVLDLEALTVEKLI
jgi:hypothetical protein